MPPIVLVRCLLLALVTSASPALAQDAGALPDEVRRALDAAFPSWRVPTEAELTMEASPYAYCQSPPLLEGDFDGDGAGDYVVQFMRPDSLTARGESLTVAVVLLRDGTGEVHVLSQVGDALDTYPAGERVRLPLEGVEFTLETDAVEVGWCEKASVLYFHYGGSFVPVTTGD